MNRKKFLLIYIPFMLLFGFFIFFGLKIYSRNKFSQEKFKFLTQTTSVSKDKVTDLCRYQILSEPKVDNRYVKINFWCQNGTKARSTLALEAIENNSTVAGILKEYSRIINFDYSLIQANNWYCLFNDQVITDFNQSILPASTIDCFENKNLSNNDPKNF